MTWVGWWRPTARGERWKQVVTASDEAACWYALHAYSRKRAEKSADLCVCASGLHPGRKL